MAEDASLTGATHRHRVSGEHVRATVWEKDGDHALVRRYPIDAREYKGLLVVDDKTRFALRFGDVIVEDSSARLFVVDRAQFDRDYMPLGG